MAGREVLSIGISKAKGSSDVTVYHEVRKVLDELHRENPDVAFQELFTSVVYIEQQYESALHAMMEGAVLAVLVVFPFLRDFRATIISALAIPLSAIPKIGRAHVCTPVTTAHLVCRLLLDKNKI